MTLDSDYIQSLVDRRQQPESSDEEDEDDEGVSFYETKRAKANRKKPVVDEGILKGRSMEYEVHKH